MTITPFQTFLMVLMYVLLFNFKPGLSEADDDPFARARHHMIENDLKARDISDASVLQAMEKVPRHLFVAEAMQNRAYGDFPLPIAENQTISQPYIVAFMTQCLTLKKEDKILEIGTGSGYQAAVLAEIVNRVYSIEINKKLAAQADRLLKSLGYGNINIKAGDGFFGWEDHAPYDGIIITCSVGKIPPALIKQLKPGGKIILPLGEVYQTQTLILGTKRGEKIITEPILPVRFVPMTGEAEKK